LKVASISNKNNTGFQTAKLSYIKINFKMKKFSLILIAFIFQAIICRAENTTNVTVSGNLINLNNPVPVTDIKKAVDLFAVNLGYLRNILNELGSNITGIQLGFTATMKYHGKGLFAEEIITTLKSLPVNKNDTKLRINNISFS
jgi:hypothetical protein